MTEHPNRDDYVAKFSADIGEVIAKARQRGIDIDELIDTTGDNSPWLLFGTGCFCGACFVGALWVIL